MPRASRSRACRSTRNSEARAIAALNHHNICTVYDVGYLVMEMVAGPTLAEIIATRPVSLLESLRMAGQVGRALERHTTTVSSIVI